NAAPSSGFLDNVHVQGAGLAHIDRTILNAVSVAPGKLALGDASGGPVTRTLTFTNKGASAVTYTLSHAAALTSGPNQFTAVTSNETSVHASVSFSAPTITVPAGGSATVDATITAPAITTLFIHG